MDSSFLQPTLKGSTISLHPLESSHFEELYQAASDPLIWAEHPRWDRYKRDVFARLFDDSMESGGALVVVHNDSGQILGSSRYYGYSELNSEICIGYSFLIRDVWGGAVNREVKNLLIDHAFAKVSTIWFHVDVSNTRSQKAMLKIGAIESHVDEVTFNGKTSRYVFFKIQSPWANN